MPAICIEGKNQIKILAGHQQKKKEITGKAKYEIFLKLEKNP